MKFCLLGRKLFHSYSKEIHNKSGYHYDIVEVEPEDVEDFIKTNDYNGFNVTIPYKETVMNYLDEISDEAKAIGSVNTVVNVGKKVGFNTDVYGLNELFKGVVVDGKNVLILGSGGTYKTAAYLLKNKGAKSITCVSRKGTVNYDNVYELFPDTEIVVNCTPVGMFPDVFKSPIDLSRFKKLFFVADCVYNPLRTMLTVQAENLGIKNVNGLKMLVLQALKAEEIWTGDAQDKKSRKIFNELYFEKGNIVLYGMPSCGKSVIGKEIAKILNRKFYDTDELITLKTGKSPAKIIKNNGEEFFRNLESQVIKELATINGAVVSLGGGAVLREENVSSLKLNGKLIYIKRDLNLLSEKGRPLSQKFGVKELYEMRKDVYDRVKDCEIVNDDDIKIIAEKVISAYENSCN